MAVVAGTVGCGSTASVEPAPVPTPIGRGVRFMPPPAGAARATNFPCTRGPLAGPIRIHLELFAQRRVVIVPPLVGVGRDCRYPLRTTEPTGVIQADRPGLTLGDFFAVWGMPLGPQRLLSFHGPVSAFVAGKPWPSEVRAIPLYDRGQIVLEVGGYVPPHAFYLFPPR